MEYVLSPTESSGSAPAPVASILLVDDHEANLMALQATLQPLGQRLVIARSGEEALARLLDEEFACVLLDVQMPGMDGFETAHLIRSRERTRHLPIVFLTALGREEQNLMRAYSSGAIDYLVKPFNPDVLRSKVSFFVHMYAREKRLMEREGREAALSLRADLSAAIGEAGDVRELLTHCANAIAARAGAALVRVWESAGRASELELVASAGPLGGGDTAGAPPRVEKADIGRTAERQLPYISDNAVHDPRILDKAWAVREGIRAFALFPLVVEDRAVGVVSVYARDRIPQEILETLAVGADALAQAVERKRAEGHLRFLAAASDHFASSLDYDAIGQRVAESAVPHLADWCIVDLVREDGWLECVGVAHVDPTLADCAATLRTKSPKEALPAVTRRVLHTGRSERVTALRDEQLERYRTLTPRSCLVVPMTVRRQILGTMTFLFTASRRRHSDSDVPVAEELARRAAQALESARMHRETVEAVRLRDEFLSVASHELKTPLTPLALKLNALRRLAEGQPGGSVPGERVLADLEVASRQVRRLADLVSALLDVSRLTRGMPSLALERVDLSAIARDVVARFGPQASAAGCELTLLGEGPLVGEWDPMRVDQVLTNLLSNAIKYGAGQPVEIHLSQVGERAVIRVSDKGIGIPPESLARIFGKFERAVSDRHYGGLGLGLFITRQIVEAHGGTIQVESTPGDGASFTVELPLVAGTTLGV